MYLTDDPKSTGEGAQGNVIRKIDAATGLITRIAGGGYFTLSAVGGPATSANLGTTVDMNIDDAGNVYLLEGSMGLIWKLSK